MKARGWLLALSALTACRGSSADPDGGAPDAPHVVPNLGRTANGLLGERGDAVVLAITTSDSELLWERPALAQGKYALMVADPYAFFRGSLSLYLHDWTDPTLNVGATRFPLADLRVMGLGDAHPENFGTMRAADGTFRVEPNDFDTADVVPILWDVRRFGVGMCLAARLSNATDAAARSAAATVVPAIVRTAIASYVETIRSLAAGAKPPEIVAGTGGAVLDDLFLRSAADWDDRAELGQLTTVAPVRRFVRGAPDPAQPIDWAKDLPAGPDLELSRALAGYQQTLAQPPLAERVPLDAVQVFGQGVGSFGRVRALVLTRGPTTAPEDDVILEVKELPPPDGLPLPWPSVFRSPQERVAAALRAGWTQAGADPLWGEGRWAGLPVQIRSRAAGFKTVRISRLEGPLGTVAAISDLGAQLARLIARMHVATELGSPNPTAAFVTAIGADTQGFVDEQATVALAACDRVQTDWEVFKRAVELLGPTLGVEGITGHAPTPDLRALFDPASDPAAAGAAPVQSPFAINEIAATGREYVEIVNIGKLSASLSGFLLADEDTDGGPRSVGALQFGSGATLSPRARVVALGGKEMSTPTASSDCGDGLRSCFHAAWSIDASRGERVFLLFPDGVIEDRVAFPAAPLDEDDSWGRFPDGTGAFTTCRDTPGAANARR